MRYALQRNAAGQVIGAAATSDPNAAFPDGHAVCTADEYRTEIQAMRDTLPIRAQRALVPVRAQAALVVAMGGTFSPAMQAYVRAVQAIADGTDTTSTALPTEPSS